MPGMTRVAALLAVVASVAAIAGCGSNDVNGTIPQANADQMVSELDAVETSLASGDCAGAQAHAQDFLDHVNLLPETAGTALKAALRGGGENLQSLVAQCQSGVTGPTGNQTTSPERSSTKHTNTDTTSTESTTTEPTTTAPEPQGPPGNGNGNANGIGNGQGNGNAGVGNPGNDNTGGGGSTGGTGGTGGTGIGGD